MFTKKEGLILYWCEGSKALDVSAVSNTNPEILKRFIEWITKHYGIKKEKLKMQLYLWDSINENKSKEFWSKELGLSNKSFYKTYIKKKEGNYRKHKYLYGVCRVSFCNKKIAKIIQQDIHKLLFL